MSTQQDIYAAGLENPPFMLNKDNYISWSSRLFRYTKSKFKEKLLLKSILKGLYQYRMIKDPGDPDRLTEDIYVVVDNCNTANEMWLQIQKMMKELVRNYPPTKTYGTARNHGRTMRCANLWRIGVAEVGEGQLIGPELVQETTKKISQIKDRLKAARDRVVCFGKKGKLAPRYVGPFEITKRIGHLAYRLRLPQELNDVHDTFHVSNLKKCLADPTLQIPLNEIQVDAKLNFVEEPVEILEREFKKLKRSRIAIVKVRWSSKQGPEFTWEREDQMKLKYPHLFSSSTSKISGRNFF
ncbi:hypothetical protein Tco_0183722 [Tanacetum coccineum]